ncbi:MAG: hypothetical protein IKF90_03475, partial [Parasporobacterium sp.]|nr:hypothetical protein [Parasporobacterium sp.]
PGQRRKRDVLMCLRQQHMKKRRAPEVLLFASMKNMGRLKVLLCTTMQDVTCSEKVKRIEITALEQYMETGKSGIQNIDQSEEEQND